MTFPENRPEDYDADQLWDEDTAAWYDKDTAIGSARQSQAGGRYDEKLVVVSDAGKIYFGQFPDPPVYYSLGQIDPDSRFLTEFETGDLTAIFTPGTTFDVVSASNAVNNDSYTVLSSEYGGIINDNTEIIASPDTSVFEFPTSALIGNVVTREVPEGSFILVGIDETNGVGVNNTYGDVTATFSEAATFDITGSTSNDGSYTVSRSEFDDPFTSIFTIEPLTTETPTDGIISNVEPAEPLPEGSYRLAGILDNPLIGLGIAEGDQTAVFTTGTTFDITDSTSNDGSYTVVSSSYGVVTLIVPAEATVTEDPSGGIISNVITA